MDTARAQFERDEAVKSWEVAEKILHSAKTSGPTGGVMSEDEVWGSLKEAVRGYIPQTATTELDRLRQLNKRKRESWRDFIARYANAAPWIAPSYRAEHCRVLMDKLPHHLL